MAKSTFVKTLMISATALMAPLAVPLSGGVEAQADSRRHIGSYRDWDAFVYGSGSNRTCHMISVPKSSTASKKNVLRGDIYVMISHKPKFAIVGEVNAVLGYPIRQGSESEVRVDGRYRAKFFTEGNAAWAYDPKDDSNAVAAMKRGNGMVITATSQRGTSTTDRYSLSGFTAAYNAITKACG
jgi:hypothetical protein